ncbi:paraquat-inducible protein A [Suttonella sp. R2A3]|uniref:paraquat-inducible protein A n=1 Tax=Suttonella sp. R2A3 TaxID=2908648 RepID=UPI001F219B8A|nr:paraquat-inducible protein A [Suttonella sp. R2A3]UJF24357.1 paraquat-inducible protein A [Suttonella sp. R2A3]
MSRWRIIMLVMIAVGVITLILGLVMPMMTVSKMVVVSNEFSILSGIGALLADKTFGLGLILLTFSVIFPLVKFIGMAAYLYYYPAIPNALVHWQKTLSRLAKFSMLDVFVVALMLMIVKLGYLVEVTIHHGIYWFSAAVIISMISGILIERDIAQRIHG